MNGRTLGILKRLSLVVGVLLYWHLAARVLAYVTQSKRPEYRKPFFSNALIGNSWGDWAFAHLGGLIVGLIAGVFIALIVITIAWVIEGPSPYVDPCNDPKCPCARHEKERRDAENARIAATAALTAAVVSTVIN